MSTTKQTTASTRHDAPSDESDADTDEEESESTAPERRIEHELDDRFDGDALATLSPDQEDAVQLQEMRRRTVGEDMMKLSVSSVETDTEKTTVAVDVDHPIRTDPLTFYLDKPVDGWTDENELVRMFKWYGIDDDNPHKLKLRDVYVEKNAKETDQNHDWMLVEPPDWSPPPAPMREQLRQKKDWVLSKRPVTSNAKMYAFIMSGVIGGSVLSSILVGAVSFAPSIVVSTLVTVVTVIATTLVGTGVLEP